MAIIEINTNLDEILAKLTAMCEMLDKIEEKAARLEFLTMKDMQKKTGWAAGTVQELFKRKDFPACDFGKEKVVELNAVINYFSVPRRK